MNDRESLRIPLRSPSTGVIAISNVLAGQIVESKDILFEVIDPNRIWVEAAAFDMDVVNNLAGAIAVTDAGKTYQLTYIGRAPRLRQQAIPLNFRIENPDTSLTVGSPANVFIKGHNTRTAVVLPQRAITTTASGQSIVFEHVSPEHFIPVLIRSEDVDGTNSVILAGLQPGMRVVIDGAGLLGQIR
jgi:multidrug efflux pump subunit AcrA (membrane-fusion protein)